MIFLIKRQEEIPSRLILLISLIILGSFHNNQFPIFLITFGIKSQEIDSSR